MTQHNSTPVDPAVPDDRALEEAVSRKLLQQDDLQTAQDVLDSLESPLFDAETTSNPQDVSVPIEESTSPEQIQDDLAPENEATDSTNGALAIKEPDIPTQKPHNGKTRMFFIGLGLCLAVSLTGLGLRLICENRLLHANTMHRVSISDVVLDGMTKEEALAALQEAFDDKDLDVTLRFTFEDEVFTQPLSAFDPHYELEQALTQAWSVGRTGTRAQRLFDIYQADAICRTLSMPCTLSEAAARQYTASLAEQIDCDVQEPAIAVNPENDGVNNLFVQTEEIVGKKLNQQALVTSICQSVENNFAPIALDVALTQPQQTLAQLMQDVQLIRTFTTEYDYLPARVFNIHRATDAINGTVLQPGGEFSFNETVGNTSLAENGYKEWYVIVGGKNEMDRGGGVCQAATTLYNVAVRCDMEILAREPHAIASSYVPKGQDATIAYGAYDLRFRNTSECPIYIFGSYTDTSVTFSIYGRPLKDGVTIEMESELLGVRYPGEAKVSVDYSKPVGYRSTTVSALNGYDVRVYKLWFDSNGNEINRIIDHVDAYPTRRAEVVIGGAQPVISTPAPEPTPVPEPEPEPETPETTAQQ